MAIVDMAFYSTVYMGQEATDCDFPAMEARAEDVIGAMTHWAVTADTIASLPASLQTLVKKAICAQVDYFAVNGLDSIAGSTGQGFTVGRVSVNGQGGAAGKGVLSSCVAPLAVAYLEQTGLLNPQVPTALDMPMIGWWM